MKFSYNTTYFPAAPHIEIRLGIPDESLKVGPLLAFVDSGADGTLIPARYVRPLQLEIFEHKFLLSQWGERRLVATYRLDVEIGDIRLPAIEIVADDQSDEVVVGRNVLNKLRVLLDGPKQLVEISE
jgi:predicted aspartyl protease